MNQNTQTTTPAGAVLNKDWMRRIEAALASNQLPAYDDLELGVHALLSEMLVIRMEFKSLVEGAAAAFDFIDQECKLIDVKKGLLSIRLELDCDVFTREGARGAISARIAVLAAAKQEAAESAMEAELI